MNGGRAGVSKLGLIQGSPSRRALSGKFAPRGTDKLRGGWWVSSPRVLVEFSVDISLEAACVGGVAVQGD